MARVFHPLLFFYLAGFVLTPIGFVFGCYLLALRVAVGPIADTSALFAVFLFITGMQFPLFVMWCDMAHDKLLR